MRRLENWQDLQTVIGVTEAPDLDFKETLDHTEDNFAVETRKDIAALANTLGGHIVVGASTEAARTRCKGFHGIDASLAAALSQRLEVEGKDHCRPTPFLSSHVIDHPDKPGKVVLVLAVSMSPNAPVGASLRQNSGGHLVDEGWCFPYRVGSLTRHLTPDQFGAYESMSARRAAALLGSIVKNSSILVQWRDDARPVPSPSQSREAVFEGHDLEKNVAQIRFVGLNASQPVIWVPLDDVTTVWWAHDDKPTVALRGTLRFSQGVEYCPAC